MNKVSWSTVGLALLIALAMTYIVRVILLVFGSNTSVGLALIPGLCYVALHYRKGATLPSRDAFLKGTAATGVLLGVPLSMISSLATAYAGDELLVYIFAGFLQYGFVSLIVAMFAYNSVAKHFAKKTATAGGADDPHTIMIE